MQIIGDKDYEEIIIGVLLSPFMATMHDVIFDKLKPEEFAFIQSKHAYKTAQQLYTDGVEINMTTLKSDICDIGYLSNCMIEASNNTQNDKMVYYFIDMIKLKAVRRNIATTASNVLDAVGNPQIETYAILDMMQVQIDGDDEKTSKIADLLPEFLDKTEARAKNKSFDGIPYFLPRLNKYTAGKEPGQFIIFGGRPGDGKSSIMLDDAVYSAQQGESVLLFTLEVTKQHVTRNAVSITSRVPVTNIKRGEYLDGESWRKIHKASGDLFKLDFTIHDEAGMTPQAIARKIQAVKPSIVYIDYIQLMTNPDTARHGRTQEMSSISKLMKEYAKHFGIPIIVGAQLNRDVVGSSVPMPYHLKETGSLEQDADVIILLHPEKDGDTTLTPTQVRIAKNRDGEVGIVSCLFDKPILTYKELDNKRMAAD